MKYATHRFRIPLTVLGLALLLPSPLVAKDNKQQEAEALLAKARELSDIRCEGCPPFRLKARVWNRQSGALAVANYSLIWASAKLWREEVILPDSRYVTVADGKVSWRAWSSAFRPLWAFHLSILLDINKILLPNMLQRAKGIRLRKSGSPSQQCIEVDFSGDLHQQFCLSGQDGTLASSEVLGLFRVAQQWGDYVKLGDKYFPTMVHASESGKQEMAARIDELGMNPSLDSSTFSAPDNSEIWPVCETQSYPTPVRKPDPPYPESLRQQKVTGTVVLLVRVESDGRVGDAFVLRSSAEDFRASALETVKSKWRFGPAICEGTAIRSEVLVEVTFRLW